MAAYTWTLDGAEVSDRDLANFTLENAHRWYSAARVFTVEERDGHVSDGGSESVYREDAFNVAAEQLGMDYDVLYVAWRDGVPVSA